MKELSEAKIWSVRRVISKISFSHKTNAKMFWPKYKVQTKLEFSRKVCYLLFSHPLKERQDRYFWKKDRVLFGISI